ncbi:unnamed protein product [Vitrella brassicaformis CCMP3155]|uniref:Uncharacterized protein n=1 Tax=Vitrella brassicaformis (strain CCMP3155) TaxID=1169540 RepID=A0A0G4GDS8_VITBC|nr:unnamed protein product [Vitrella brassicaformis CCMP3155]|eukprot:CEM27573.1 unnamed protein product [Vitrella brassicaformis CCMP3155]
MTSLSHSPLLGLPEPPEHASPGPPTGSAADNVRFLCGKFSDLMGRLQYEEAARAVAEREVERLIQETNALKTERDSLKEHLQTETSRLSSENANLRQQLSNARHESLVHQREAKTLETRLTESEGALRESRRQSTHDDQVVQGLRERAKRSEDDAEGTRQEAVKLRRQNTDIESENAKLKASVENLQLQLKQAVMRGLDAEAQVRTGKNLLLDNDAMIRKLKDDLKSTLKRNSFLSEKGEKLLRQHAKLQEDHNGKDERLNVLRTENTQKEAKLRSAVQRLECIKDLEATIAQLRKDNADLDQKVREIAQEKVKAIHESTGLSHLLHDRTNESEALRFHLEQVKAEESLLRKELEVQQSAADSMATRLEQADGHKHKNEAMIQTLINDIKEANRELETLREEKKELMSKSQTFNEKAASIDATATQLRKRLQHSSSLLQASQEALDDERQTRQTCQREVILSRERFGQLRKKYTSMLEEYKELKRSASTAVRQLDDSPLMQSARQRSARSSAPSQQARSKPPSALPTSRPSPNAQDDSVPRPSPPPVPASPPVTDDGVNFLLQFIDQEERRHQPHQPTAGAPSTDT